MIAVAAIGVTGKFLCLLD